MKFEKIIIISSILLSALIISKGLNGIGKAARTVTVRGLCEKEVDADLAVWPMSFTIGSNDLPSLQQSIIAKTKIIEEYLTEHGLSEEDYTVQAPNITDNSVDPYIDRDSIKFTYIAKATIFIRSSKVNEVKKAQEDSLSLAGKGIAIKQEYDSQISFEFTGLNEIKPQMIASATQNARQAAEQFARDSDSKVGKITKATQGLFSIENAAAGLAEKKTVRVVTTIEYELK
ncbi:MAG: SIMPL domain-containing protein [Treponema sp.]|nr:SIMPL domain-containing protein [Treponema sp.]